MATNLVASTGTLLIIVVLLGQAGMQAEESPSPTPISRKQDCKASIVGDRAFVTCNFTVDVGRERMKFHLQYRSATSSVNDPLKTDYEIALLCLWPDNATSPTCIGETGYRLNSTNLTSIVVIEVPRQGVEAKTYQCQIAGYTNSILAQPCCFDHTTDITTATTTFTAAPTGIPYDGKGSGDEKKLNAMIGVAAGLGISLIVMLVVIITLRKRLRELNVKLHRFRNNPTNEENVDANRLVTQRYNDEEQ